MIVFSIAGLYVAIVYSLLDDEPAHLLSCVDVNAPWSAWTCKQVLRYASLTPDQVRDLNAQAGALYPVLMDDPQEAEEMLSLFLARGVDVNAGDQRVKGWTALHAVAMSEPVSKVTLLLRHGARVDVRDEDGNTPLDLARRALQQHRHNPALPETILLLERSGGQ